MTSHGQPMNRDAAFRLALMVERRARLDAATWVGRLQDQARLVGRGRAEQVIEPTRTTDPLRAALSREWYVRVFQDQVRQDLGAADPTVAVTPVEAEHVAECLRAGVAYRIHGPGGSVVLNPDANQQAPGQSNYADLLEVSAQPEPPEAWHRQQLERLAQEQDRRRTEDGRMVGAAWDELTSDQRTAFAAYYHQYRGIQGLAAYPTAEPRPADPATRQPDLVYTAVDTGYRNQVTGSPAEAAAAVFDQRGPSGVAEANAARFLVAQAFPKTAQKPPTITTTGPTRPAGARNAEPRREDRGR